MALLERLTRKKNKGTAVAAKAQEIKPNPTGFSTNVDSVRETAYQAIKEKIHARIVNDMPESLQRILSQPSGNGEAEVRRIVEDLCAQAVQDDPFAIPLGDRERLLDELISEILGLGPIEPLLKDPSITEVMVNGPYSVYIERAGKLQKTAVKFKDEEHLMHVIDRIVTAVGRRVDESSPLCDARLLDGSRVNIVIPPLALSGATVTIRKFSKDKLTVDKLIEFGSMSRNMAKFIEGCVQGRMNIVVSGGTGSGKTTLLNALSSFIPATERIVTIEDSAELQLRQDHVVTLETRPANIEGEGQISMRDLVKNALRMRPDRIVVGEVRGGEALDMLQAMNTGHDGSMTTGHANSPRDMLSRLETMVLMSGMDLPLRAIRSQIASAVDIIVQTTRMRDGSRKVINISEVTGMEGDIITLQDLFVYEQAGVNEDGKLVGSFVGSGLRPMCMERLQLNGVNLDLSVFE